MMITTQAMKKTSIYQLFRPLLTALMAVTLLFGCAQLPDDQTNVQWQQHQQRLAGLTQFQASGKLGFISPDERRSMNFYWQQNGSSSQLRLTSAFGQTLLKMVTDQQGTTIETYDDERYQSVDGEALLYQLTGLIIPLNQLDAWLVGSASYADHYTLLPTNTLASQSKKLGQREWQVNYSSYVDTDSSDGNKIPLPNSLQLIQDQIKINLRISNWKIN